MDIPFDLDAAGGPGLGLAALAGVLVVLALVDSTSFGTLLVPVWLLLAPGRLRAGRVLAYLATVAVAYLAVGVVVMLGAGAFLDRFGDALDSRAATIVQLLLGIGLFALSFRFDPKRRRAGSGGVARWRDRVVTGSASAGWLVGLALLAVLAEIATMLPYLGALTMLTTSDLTAAGKALLLVAYCLVMVLPAVVLVLARALARARVEPLLHRVNRWFGEKATGATGWLLGIAGFLVARDAAARLWFL